MDCKKLKSNLFIDRTCCPCCSETRNIELYSCKFTSNPVRKYLEDFYSKQGGVEFEYFSEEEFDLRECVNCGLIYQKNILGDELMNRLYSKWIDPKFTLENIETDYDIEYYLNYTRLIYRLIKFFNKKPSKLNFLDFGMGWGNWARIVSAMNVSSFGVELSEDRIEYAKKFGVKIVDFEKLQDDFYDFINTDQVFEHLSNPNGIIQKLAKSLKKGGLLRICVPDGNGVKEQLKVMDWKAEKGHPNSLNVVAPLEHINCYNTNSIVQLAKMAGLDWVYLNHYPNLEIKQSPELIVTKFNNFLIFPIDVLRYCYTSLKALFGKQHIHKPVGTNLFFIKK